ncbi:nuclear transport factor 2 family protein [Variovorax sp. RKNM96]|uniref:nuclear transport factor 2 family protein n=1 Tax=Variovorax sp. RKNM96 TaxID=2681552 RepID=UPI00197EA972|nr:nuclear transport factor 2 family protein [Variovorax sp. RKNM96]QSI29430.1 nuclear transport factor 2 family protein [Variovorax sp. RKNM96]
MNIQEIADKLVAVCKSGKFEDALALYAPDAVSVEASAPPGGQRETVGLAGIRGKGEWWVANHEVHSMQVAGPWPHDDRFIVGFKFDVTMKPTKQRFTMEEMALYTVKDGKIVREEFFYSMG